MALSARNALLKEYRSRYSAINKIGGTIKLPSASSQASTIAKQAATAELQTKTDQYNNGLLSPEDMLAYLKGIASNSLFSLAEKAQVQNTISSFQDKVNEGKLIAAYKNTQPNTSDRAQAAQTLANFYQNQAGSMEAGSPAQSTAMQNAGDWMNQAKTEQDNVQKAQRSLDRAQKLNDIAKNTDPNSIENAQQTADAYQQLSEEAAADGDQTQAYQFSTKAQDAANKIQTIQAEQQKKVDADNKKTLLDYINSTYNDYQDGKISGDQALANLQAADAQAAQIGDTSTQLHLNSVATTIQRNEDRGITFTNDGAFGDKTGGGKAGTGELLYDPTTGTLSGGGSTSSSGSVSRGTSKGGSGGTTTTTGASSSGGIASQKTTQAAAKLGLPAQGGAGHGPVSLSEMDRTYQNAVSQANQWLLAGQAPDGSPFRADEYMKVLQALANDRANDLTNITGQLSQADPNTKIKYGTSTTTVGSLLDGAANGVAKGYTHELQQVQVESSQFQNGDLVPVMTTNKDSETGIPTPSIQLTPASSIPNFQQDYIIDSSGVAHKTDYQRQYLSQDQVDQLPYGTSVNHDGPYAYIDGNQFVDIYDTAGRRIRYFNDPKYGFLPDPTSVGDSALQKELQNYQDTIKKESDAIVANGGKQPFYNPVNFQQFQNFANSGELGNRMYGSIYNNMAPDKTVPNTTNNNPAKAGPTTITLNGKQTTAPQLGIPGAVTVPLNTNGSITPIQNVTPGHLPPLPVVKPVLPTSAPMTETQIGHVVAAQPLRLPTPLSTTGTFNPSTGNSTPTQSRAQASTPVQQPLKIVGNQPLAPVNNSGVKVNLGTPPQQNAINNVPAVPKPQPQQPNLLQQIGSKIGSFFGGLF